MTTNDKKIEKIGMQVGKLPGVAVGDIVIRPDERGFFSEGFRIDWKEFTQDDIPQQVNISYSYPGVVRAWHRHLRGQVDYFIVLQGSMKICAFDEEKGVMDEIVVSDKRLQIVRIPGKYWHGTKTVSSNPSLTVYLTTKTYDRQNPDEERRPWDSIKTANGKPFDWNANINK